MTRPPMPVASTESRRSRLTRTSSASLRLGAARCAVVASFASDERCAPFTPCRLSACLM